MEDPPGPPPTTRTSVSILGGLDLRLGDVDFASALGLRFCGVGLASAGKGFALAVVAFPLAGVGSLWSGVDFPLFELA